MLPYKVLLECEGKTMELDVFQRRLPARPSRAGGRASRRAPTKSSRRSPAGKAGKLEQDREVNRMATTAELNSSQPLLVQLLLEKEILTPEQVEALNEARSQGPRLAGKHPGKKGLVMDQHIAEVYADYLMLPLFDMVPDEADPKLAEPAARKALPRPPAGAGGAARRHAGRGLRHLRGHVDGR